MYGTQTMATLEAIVCREALSLADDPGLQRIIISSDAKQLVSDLESNSCGRYGTIIAEVMSRAENFTCNSIFEGRSVNLDAHDLARFPFL